MRLPAVCAMRRGQCAWRMMALPHNLCSAAMSPRKRGTEVMAGRMMQAISKIAKTVRSGPVIGPHAFTELFGPGRREYRWHEVGQLGAMHCFKVSDYTAGRPASQVRVRPVLSFEIDFSV